jgi:hypothetical protein
VPKSFSDFATEMFDRMSRIEGQQCQECTAIATVPEWWEYRPESKRPQGILVFQELKADGTIGNDPYSITIPHCNLGTAPIKAPLTTYKKGNWQGILTLKDNSKLIVNCVDVDEVNRVIGALSKVIDPAYLVGSFVKIGPHRGLDYKTITVRVMRLDYYPNGSKNMKPAYVKSFF